ncbi:MAG: TadE/TadG family type IV pilus assembly protein [Betaproteobacteria bacterium]
MRLVREEKGQAVVELSLVMALLLLMLLGIITFGRLMNISLTLTYASREGARAAALFDNDETVTQTVLQVLPATIDPLQVQVNVSPAQGSRPRGTPVTVTVSFPVQIQVPLLVEVLGRNRITLLGTTTMRSEI